MTHEQIMAMIDEERAQVDGKIAHETGLKLVQKTQWKSEGGHEIAWAKLDTTKRRFRKSMTYVKNQTVRETRRNNKRLTAYELGLALTN
jgi:hypothetical protein